MIDYSEIRRIVENKIDLDFSDLPVEFENTFIDPPDSEHVKIIITETESNLLDISSNLRLVNGDLVIQIFIAVGSGTEKARSAASSLHSIICDGSLAPSMVFSGEAELISVGASDGSPLYQYNLVIPFMYVYG